MNDFQLLTILVGWPLLMALFCVLSGTTRRIHLIASIGAIPLPILGIVIAGRVFGHSALECWQGALRLDSLSALLVLLITLIGAASIWMSGRYMTQEVASGEVAESRVRWYYLWLYVFLATMLTVCVVDNLGVMWVAIEATTLASAVLVGFYFHRSSVEAAWKYIVLCSVGIALALFGILLLYASSTQLLGDASASLRWSELRHIAPQLDPALLRLAFLLLLVGFGTKAGLAPMHTWLPDAHSQAPSPVSALLSGVLLSCAIYALLRVQSICVGVPGVGNTGALLAGFGLLSICVAVPFIIVQGDLKRLLAYSSVEHMGLIALGIGLGGYWAVYGALLHLVNHAITKSLLFFSAGQLVQRFGTRRISQIRGALQPMPITATLFGLALLAIGGLPPFGPFLSELTIIADGVRSGPFWMVAVALLGLVSVCAGLVFHGIRVVLGRASRQIKAGETFADWWLTGVLLLLALLLGVWIPPWLHQGLSEATRIVRGT